MYCIIAYLLCSEFKITLFFFSNNSFAKVVFNMLLWIASDNMSVCLFIVNN